MFATRGSLESALRGEPWALTGVLHGIDHVRDVNGRPLGERRAPADSRRDVPVEVVPCPYPDERQGLMMNKSALEPTMRSFAAVTAEVAGYHEALPVAQPSWTRMLGAVLDQLVAPARYLLEQRSESGPLPAELSAGHKLAAGYFGALRRLFREAIAGVAELPSPTTEQFAQFVQQRRSLIGASEVCAGPAYHMNILTQLFMEGRPAGLRRPLAAAPVSAQRVRLAELLVQQVQLGIVYEVCDERFERALLLDGAAARPLPTRTSYLADRLAQRADELLAVPAPRRESLAPHLPLGGADAALRAAVADIEGTIASAEEAAAVLSVIEAGDAAVLLPAELRHEYARRLTALLRTHRLFVRAQWRLEQELRQVLGYRVEVGFALNSTLCPRPRALEWFDVLTGHTLQWSPSEHQPVTARNHRREVVLG